MVGGKRRGSGESWRGNMKGVGVEKGGRCLWRIHPHAPNWRGERGAEGERKVLGVRPLAGTPIALGCCDRRGAAVVVLSVYRGQADLVIREGGRGVR